MRTTLYRIKQFFKGLFSFGGIDYTLADTYLNGKEREIFFRLPLHERRHAIDTANTILSFDVMENKTVLIKAGLLHDVGKAGSGIGLIKKSILVLMDKFMPRLSHLLSNKFNMFYVYYKHPEIGANYLQSISTERNIILLVRYHHSEKNVDIEGMEVLKRADSSN